MPENYLLPEDVSASDAAMVLDFVNAAQSAEEIATAVEIPDERDIGERVALRIINRREELGGFTSLEQIYAVPYVGPERFTELVVTLSTARPPLSDEQAAAALLEQFTERLNSLEAQLQRPSTILLRAAHTNALLGQETVVLAELKDGQGKPLVDHELTVVTNWGVLTGRVGLRPVQGSSITLRSDHLGLCKFRFSASIDEALTDVERASLRSALTVLETPNDSPRDSLPQLSELARLYRAPGNDTLRRAIDVYFKRFASENSNAPIDSLANWPTINTTLVAWLTPPAGSATAQVSSSLLNVSQRNWFYAWLWAYRLLLQDETQLGESLASIDSGNRSGNGILSDVFSRVGGFVNAQSGLVGRQLGQDFAASNLSRFLQTGLANFPEGDRSKVVTGISSGIKSLATPKAFASFENSRAEINMEIDAKVASIDSSAQVDALNDRLTTIESSAITQADIDTIRTDILNDANQQTNVLIDQFRTEIDLDLSTKADIDSVALIGQQVTSLESQATTLDTRVQQLATNQQDVSVRIGRIETRTPRPR